MQVSRSAEPSEHRPYGLLQCLFKTDTGNYKMNQLKVINQILITNIWNIIYIIETISILFSAYTLIDSIINHKYIKYNLHNWYVLVN